MFVTFAARVSSLEAAVYLLMGLFFSEELGHGIVVLGYRVVEAAAATFEKNNHVVFYNACTHARKHTHTPWSR